MVGDAVPRPARARRWPQAIGSYVLTLLALLTLNFLLPRAMPGDPIEALVAESSSGFTFGEQSRRALEEYYELDGSLLSQYGSYVTRLARGDLGRSTATLAPGARGDRPAAALDPPAGRELVARRHGRRPHHRCPLGLAPRSPGGPDAAGRPPRRAAVGLSVGTYLVMRAGMVGELGSDHLLLGRAKGLGDRRLKYRYAARNALLPVVSLAGLQLGFVVTGDVLVDNPAMVSA